MSSQYIKKQNCRIDSTVQYRYHKLATNTILYQPLYGYNENEAVSANCWWCKSVQYFQLTINHERLWSHNFNLLVVMAALTTQSTATLTSHSTTAVTTRSTAVVTTRSTAVCTGTILANKVNKYNTHSTAAVTTHSTAVLYRYHIDQRRQQIQ